MGAWPLLAVVGVSRVATVSLSLCPEPWSADVAVVSPCCHVDNAELIKCVAGQQACPGPQVPEAAQPRMAVVSSVSPEIEDYARYSMAVNSAWAARFGHHFVLHNAAEEAPGSPLRYHSIVGVTREAMRTAPQDVGWVLRLDADVILGNFDEDLIMRTAVQHPDAEVLICEANQVLVRSVKRNSVFNFGVVLFKRSKYTEDLLDYMLDNLGGAMIDQDLFGLMHQSNWRGLVDVTVRLPETALNSGHVAITQSPRGQPVYHFWSHTDDVRKEIFEEAYSQMCLGQRVFDLNATYISALEQSSLGGSASSQLPRSGGSTVSRAQWSSWRLGSVLAYWQDTEAGIRWLQHGLTGVTAWGKVNMWDHLAAFLSSIRLWRLLRKSERYEDMCQTAREALQNCKNFLQDSEPTEIVRLLWERCEVFRVRAGKAFYLAGHTSEAESGLKLAFRRLTDSPWADQSMEADHAAVSLLHLFPNALPDAVSVMQDAMRSVATFSREVNAEVLLLRAKSALFLSSQGLRKQATVDYSFVLKAYLMGAPVESDKDNDWERVDTLALETAMLRAGKNYVETALTDLRGNETIDDAKVEVLQAGDGARAWRLAVLFTKQNLSLEAETWLRRAARWGAARVASPQTRFGTVSALFDLEALLMSQGRVHEVLEVLREAVERCDQWDDPSDPHMSAIYVKCTERHLVLVDFLCMADQWEEARPFARSALRRQQLQNNTDPLIVARVALAVASLEEEPASIGTLTELRMVVDRAALHLVKESGERLLLKAQLGFVLERAGFMREATAEFESILPFWSPKLVFKAIPTRDMRPLLEALAVATGEPAGGRKGRALLRIMCVNLPDTHVQAAGWCLEYGIALSSAGRFDDAERQLLKALRKVDSGQTVAVFGAAAQLRAVRRARHKAKVSVD